MKPKVLGLLILLTLLLILIFQNTQEVVFRIFLWKISMSQVILVPLAALVGFFFGYLVGRTGKGGKK
jgi:uncharacterized integral membrane protein